MCVCVLYFCVFFQKINGQILLTLTQLERIFPVPSVTQVFLSLSWQCCLSFNCPLSLFFSACVPDPVSSHRLSRTQASGLEWPELRSRWPSSSNWGFHLPDLFTCLCWSWGESKLLSSDNLMKNVYSNMFYNSWILKDALIQFRNVFVSAVEKENLIWLEIHKELNICRNMDITQKMTAKENIQAQWHKDCLLDYFILFFRMSLQHKSTTFITDWCVWVCPSDRSVNYWAQQPPSSRLHLLCPAAGRWAGAP